MKARMPVFCPVLVAHWTSEGPSEESAFSGNIVLKFLLQYHTHFTEEGTKECKGSLICTSDMTLNRNKVQTQSHLTAYAITYYTTIPLR